MRRIGNQVVSFLRSRTGRQSGLLIAMQGISILMAFGLTVLIARGLDVEAYGKFRYSMTFLALAMTLLQFGWPYSAARLLALESDRLAQKQVVGACVVLVIISSVIGTVVTILGLLVASAHGYDMPRLPIWVAFFMYVTLGQYMIASICQGLNRISLLSFQQVLPYALLLPVTMVLVFVLDSYSLNAAIVSYAAVFSVVITIGFVRLGLAFTNWSSWLRVIVHENRRTGFPIYVGGVFGVASAQLIAMWVAEFASFSRYGQFALAIVIASPLSVLVSSVGTVIFRSSSTSNVLSKGVLVFSFAFGGSLGLVYLVVVETFLVRVFGSQYGLSVRMAEALGLGALMTGWGDIFQRFLGAKGQGKALCVAAVSTGTVGMVSASILLPKWNVYGAVAASVLTAGTYLGLMLTLYVRHTVWRGQGQADLPCADSIACGAQSVM
jgi:O-antigen/teichoic acid export membrane protein